MNQRELINQQNAQRVMENIRAAQAQRRQNKEDDEVMTMVHAHHLEVLKQERMRAMIPEPAIPAVEFDTQPITIRDRRQLGNWNGIIAGCMILVISVVSAGWVW